MKDAQNTINGASFNVGIGTNSYEISLGNAAGDISNIISSLIQQMRRFVIRKATTVINNLIGNVPLSARYLPMKQLIKHCLLYLVCSLESFKDLKE